MYSQGFVIAGILSVLIWSYLLLVPGRFWQVDRTVVFSKHIPNFSRVAVVLPARNEEGVVARCITSLLEQTCWESIHIFLVDDFSTDSTIAVTREAAERAGKSALLTVTACGPLPSGWTGKLWAVRLGIEEASLFNPKYVLLTDADIVHDPQSIATLLQIAESGGYDLVSVTGRSECETLAERLLMPAFTFFFLMLYPPAWIEDPRRKTAGADGGCILIRSDALARVGGVESIRHEVIDDCALARSIKRSGGKLYMGVSNLTASVRGHESFSQMGRVISRTAFSQLRHSTLLLLATLVGLAITYVLPVVMTFSNVPVLMALGMSAWAVMTLCYFPVVRFYGLKPQWSLTLPMAVLFYMAATSGRLSGFGQARVASGRDACRIRLFGRHFSRARIWGDTEHNHVTCQNRDNGRKPANPSDAVDRASAVPLPLLGAFRNLAVKQAGLPLTKQLTFCLLVLPVTLSFLLE